jgi:hypothetical protein
VQVYNRTLGEAIWERDSYGLLLLLLLIDYVMLSTVDSSRWGGLAHAVPISLTVLLGMHTSGASRRLVRLAQFSVAVALIAGTIQAVAPGKANGAVANFLLVLLLLAMPLAILRRILRHREVTVETLLGAVCVYISIGLLFAALFTGMAKLMHDPAFLAQPNPNPHPSSDYVYLSFVTLTTVGFGDLTPLANAARTVVVLEAIIGQIFLVTLVARLVALYSASDRRPSTDRTQTRAHVDDDDDLPDSRLAGWFSRVRPTRGEIDDAPDEEGPPDLAGEGPPGGLPSGEGPEPAR